MSGAVAEQGQLGPPSTAMPLQASQRAAVTHDATYVFTMCVGTSLAPWPLVRMITCPCCLTADVIHMAYVRHLDMLKSAKEAGTAGRLLAAAAAAAAPGTNGGQGAGVSDSGPRRSMRLQQTAAASGAPVTGQSGKQPNITHRYAVPGGELCLMDVILGHGESGDVLFGS